uniref:Uncharacterized protein n=1 Tax=Arundo donax TaxID=35708 RepID=A0A0A9EB42_ARUDO
MRWLAPNGPTTAGRREEGGLAAAGLRQFSP